MGTTCLRNKGEKALGAVQGNGWELTTLHKVRTPSKTRRDDKATSLLIMPTQAFLIGVLIYTTFMVWGIPTEKLTHKRKKSLILARVKAKPL